MAENENGQEKTEQPTAKRMQDAKEQGQTPRSKELATFAIFGVGIATLWFMGDSIGRGTADWMRAALDFGPVWNGGRGALGMHAVRALLGLLGIMAPLIVLCLLACFIAPAVTGGLGFSVKALTPDLSKLSPAKGLARMYGREAIAEFAKSLLRIVLLSTLAVYAFWISLPWLMALMQQPLAAAVADGSYLVIRALAILCVGLMILAAVDVPYQMWSYRKNLMMTREELRQELKNSDGNPEVKGRIRRMMQQMTQGRMLEKVPAADAVIVNPTHYAVAIKYDAGKMRAPIVVAKGVDEVALAIRKVAQGHKVPIISLPPLARTLYRRVRIGSEIPVPLYAAMAEVLGYVYQLKTPGRRGPPPELPRIDIPDEE